jgi:tetratricopeptide (TPR) repeat protein
MHRVGEGWSTDVQAEGAEAAPLAESAIKLNGNDALGLAIYGHVQSFLFKDYPRAMTFLDRAIAAGPSCAMAWVMSSATCGYIGEYRLAIERGERGLRLSPQDVHRFWAEGVLAQAHYLNGDFETAVSLARIATGRTGGGAFNLRTLITSLVALDRMDEAAGTAQQLLRIQPGFRLAQYAPRCPFQGVVLDRWMLRLRMAGLPD